MNLNKFKCSMFYRSWVTNIDETDGRTDGQTDRHSAMLHAVFTGRGHNDPWLQQQQLRRQRRRLSRSSRHWARIMTHMVTTIHWMDADMHSISDKETVKIGPNYCQRLILEASRTSFECVVRLSVVTAVRRSSITCCDCVIDWSSDVHRHVLWPRCMIDCSDSYSDSESSLVDLYAMVRRRVTELKIVTTKPDTTEQKLLTAMTTSTRYHTTRNIQHISPRKLITTKFMMCKSLLLFLYSNCVHDHVSY